MASRSDQIHPAIFPPGLSEVRLEELEERFVAPGFDTPLRKRLTDQLRFFVHELVRLGVHGDVWINGSYATRKPAPRDVDLVLVMSLADAIRLMVPDCLATLQHYVTREGRHYARTKWQVDFYVADADQSSEREYWQDMLSRNPDRTSRKGIPFVRI